MPALASLSQVKEYIGNSADSTDDGLLARLTDSCSEFLERACNRVFSHQAYTETRDGQGGAHMVLVGRPVTAVSSLSIDGRAIPQSTAVGMDGWVLSSPWRISLRGDSYRFAPGVQNVEVAYTGGYAVIPSDLAQACCVLVNLAYKEKDRQGLTSKTVNGETVSFETMLPEFVERIISNYRNVATP